MGDEEGEEVLVVGQFAVGSCLGVLVRDCHIVESAMSWGPDEFAGDVFSLQEEFKHVVSEEE